MTNEQIGDAVVRLLRDREPVATICPSEAARALVPDAWRPLMPVWWTDGAPDCNRKLAKNTPCRDWFSRLPGEENA